MKQSKIIIALILFVSIVGGASAIEFNWQNYADCVKQGDILVNAGIGFGTPVAGDMVIPPIQASVEYVLPIAGFPTSFGGLFGISTSSYDFLGSKSEYTYMAFGGRASWHFDLGIDKLDTYSSLALGYFMYSAKSSSIAATTVGSLYYGFNVGARYFFTPVIGASVEIGYSALSYLAAGISLKF